MKIIIKAAKIGLAFIGFLVLILYLDFGYDTIRAFLDPLHTSDTHIYNIPTFLFMTLILGITFCLRKLKRQKTKAII